MPRFWVYLENKVQGPVDVPALRKLPGFNLLTQVCAEGQEAWRVADEVIEIKAYFSAPPRASSLEPENQPELSTAESLQADMPVSNAGLSADTVPPLTLHPLAGGKPIDIEVLDTPAHVTVVGNTVTQPAPADGLRQSCATCGYKNPRDVAVCMKCGGPLKPGGAPEKTKTSLNALADLPAISRAASAPAATPELNSSEIKAEPPMVEIPIKRIAIILASVVFVGGTFFAVRHLTKGKKSKTRRTVVVQHAAPAAPAAKAAARPKAKARPAGAAIVKPAMPGMAGTPAHRPSSEREKTVSERPAQVDRRAPAPREPEGTETASYTVLDAAQPVKHRTAAPVDSAYAVKRRGDRGLWASREQEAIQLVQMQRIYGGQRTIRRNAEILMQILRDREYSAAFESGKRIHLFNDADWAATQKDNTVYEVRLTFSGGRESDGSPRAPLRFAFLTDLERRTVEPGGSSMIKANTVHAFFDESRIPPEERRSVAKDTEELIQAAEPGASPLALDTVSKSYAATYSVPALTRVAQAYGLHLVTKRLANQTPSVAAFLENPKDSAKTKAEPAGGKTAKAAAPSMSGTIEYTIQKTDTKDHLLNVRAPSQASPAKLFETLTSYDRLSQFVPDMLISRREGQDGAAVIVHTVSLTRLMFFVFKVNLHLRILERPKEHRLEFERIAGDFEKFSGYVEISPDSTRTRTLMNLNVTLRPKGFVPDWALRGMAKQFVVPVLDAIRAKAESN